MQQAGAVLVMSLRSLSSQGLMFVLGTRGTELAPRGPGSTCTQASWLCDPDRLLFPRHGSKSSQTFPMLPKPPYLLGTILTPLLCRQEIGGSERPTCLKSHS